MISTLLLSSVLMVQDNRPRIREELPNGVEILAARVDDDDTAVVVVFASTKGMAQTPGGDGMRHLLEHICAKGPNKDADRRLETEGVLLSAETTRGGLILKTSGPAIKLSLALQVLGGIVSELKTSQEEIDREIKVIGQEQKINPVWWDFVVEANKAVFGEAWANPSGKIEEMTKATPESLEAARKATFGGGSVGVVIRGGIEPSFAILRAKEAFGKLGKASNGGSGYPPVLERTGQFRIKGQGESRSVIVTGLGSPKTAVTLGVAMALAGRLGGTVAYEPSLGPGLVTIWTPELAGLNEIDATPVEEMINQANNCRRAAQSWMRTRFGGTEGTARLEAMLLTDDSVATVEAIQSFALGATDAEILAAFRMFKKGNSIEVTGR